MCQPHRARTPDKERRERTLRQQQRKLSLQAPQQQPSSLNSKPSSLQFRSLRRLRDFKNYKGINRGKLQDLLHPLKVCHSNYKLQYISCLNRELRWYRRCKLGLPGRYKEFKAPLQPHPKQPQDRRCCLQVAMFHGMDYGRLRGSVKFYIVVWLHQ